MELIKHFDSIDIRHLDDEYVVIFDGYMFEKHGLKCDMELELNGQLVPIEKSIKIRKDIAKIYEKYTPKARCGFHVQSPIIALETLKELRVNAIHGDEREPILHLYKDELDEITKSRTMEYYIDNLQIDDTAGRTYVSGFVFSYFTDETVDIEIYDENSMKIEYEIVWSKRNDLYELGMVNEDNACGYTLSFPARKEGCYNIVFSSNGDVLKVELAENANHVSKLSRIKSIFSRILNIKNLARAYKYLKKYGMKRLIKRLIRKNNVFGVPYEQWYQEHKVSQEQLDKQIQHKFAYEPLISIIVPTFNTPLNFLQEMINSVIGQSYQHWELCIADGSTQQEVIQMIQDCALQDDRIRYCLLDQNYGIAGNTNKALALATGDYVGLFDHDDLLTPDCLYEVVSTLQSTKHDIIYTDEDKTDSTGTKFKEPNFKTDYNVDLFLSHNYITHFFVVKRAIIQGVGGFRSIYDGAQDYDVMFRCIEKATSIYHIPKILYHWRMHEASTAENPASKMYCYEAGKKAIDDHLKRIGVDAQAEVLNLWGLYRIHYKIKENPMISIIIPNKDCVNLLTNCIDSLFEVNGYQNFEIIIVENHSIMKETFAYYEQIQAQYDNIKVVKWNQEFNYSAINNYGASFAKGEYLLLLNNDTEAIYKDSLSDMLGICMREEVGIVGAKLLYQDNTVQHAGIVLGIGGFADHVFRGADEEEVGYMARARINCDYSAVTAACMLVKKSLYDAVNGFSEEFKVGLNDVDFCLKIREKNKLVVYDAFSLWYHYESKTRGYEDTSVKKLRFNNEIELFNVKWKAVLKNKDPYYNDNFIVNETTGPFRLG